MAVEWRKSSYSNKQGGDCVEVAMTAEGVLLRDSKHPDGAQLTFTYREWDAFVAGAQAGEFNLHS